MSTATLPDTSMQAPVALVHRDVQVLGRRFAYVEQTTASQGPPVVLVHGLGMSHRSFLPLMPYLVQDFHVMAVDLPGCGRSEQPAAALGVDELVEALLAWQDAVGLQQAHYIGHSLGAQLVIRMLARNPHRTRSGVLIACPPDPSAPYAWQKAMRLLRDGLREPHFVVRHAVLDYLRATPAMMWETLKKSLRSDITEDALRISCPVLVMGGSNDPVVTPAWTRQLSSLIPASCLRIIAGGTHALAAQSPRPVGESIRDFLQE